MSHRVLTPVKLSVIVAHSEGAPDVRRAVEALGVACAGCAHEIIVVRPDGRAATRGSGLAAVRYVDAPAGSLVPKLWAVGFEASSGEVVAFTTAEFAVSPGWSRALLAAIDAGADGAGGCFVLGREAGAVAAATYFLRYSAYLPTRAAGPVAEIAGDNAAYARPALERHAASFVDGFWEVDFHRRLRAEGGRLVLVHGAEAVYEGSDGFLPMARQRFVHGRHSGEYRVRVGRVRRWRGVLAAPLVPLVLIGRITRRAWSGGEARRRLAAALPVLFGLTCAWALGEAVGSVRHAAAAAVR
jgi:hypothetical protein